jgi:hypothetical protein
MARPKPRRKVERIYAESLRYTILFWRSKKKAGVSAGRGLYMRCKLTPPATRCQLAECHASRPAMLHIQKPTTSEAYTSAGIAHPSTMPP